MHVQESEAPRQKDQAMNTVNDQTRISVEQGFAAMFEFLRNYRKEMNTANVADVLGDVQPAYGGKSSDPAAWADWIRAVEKVQAEGGST